MRLGPVPDRGARAAPALLALTGCLQADVGASLDARGLVALVVVRQTDTRLLDVEVREASDPAATWLTAVGAGTTHLLAYDHTLESLGVPLRDGQLVLADDGVPLPMPRSWIELRPGEAPIARAVSGEDAVDPARELPHLRLAPVPCRTLREDPAWRVDIPKNQRDVTFAAPIARDAPVGDRDLIAFGADPTRTQSAYLAIATSTRGLRRVQLGLDPDHPAELDARDPRGFVDLDGSAWVVTATVGGLSATTDNKQPVLCHFAVGGPYDVRACRPMRGLEPVVADRHFIRFAGFRAPGGPLELVGLTEQYDVYSWRDDSGEDRWTRRFRGGVLEDPATCDRVSAVLTMDGPGVGAVSTPHGYLARYDLSRSAPLLDPVFDRPACASAYQKHPLGHEFLVRQERQRDGSVTDDPTLHVRAPGAAWIEVPIPPGVELDTATLRPLDDTMLIAGLEDSLVPSVLNRLRPSIPPRVCSPVSVYNDASQSVVLDSSALLVAGSLPRESGRVIGRWRLVTE